MEKKKMHMKCLCFGLAFFSICPSSSKKKMMKKKKTKMKMLECLVVL